MKTILDTHVLVWLAEGLSELAGSARRDLDEAAAGDGLAVSSISFWEIAMLERRGRLSLAMPLADWRRRVLDRGVLEIAVDGEIAIESVHLPGDLHGDPADRLIVATARRRQARLATRDERLRGYARQGHVIALEV